MHVGIVHNVKRPPDCAVELDSHEMDAQGAHVGQEDHEGENSEYLAIDIYPDGNLRKRTRKIFNRRGEECNLEPMIRAVLEGVNHKVLGTLYREGDVLCLLHNPKGVETKGECDAIDKIGNGDTVPHNLIHGILGNMNDLSILVD